MIKCNISQINRLVNFEFHFLYAEIVSRLEGDEFTVEDVQQAFDKVKAISKNLDFIRRRVGKHPLSDKIVSLSKMRHQNLLSLKGRAMYSLKSPLAAEREAAHIVNIWFDDERMLMRTRTVKNQTRLVTTLLLDMSVKSELTEAIGTLGLEPVVEAIANTNEEMRSLNYSRQDDTLAHTNKTDEMRRVAYDALDTFITAIEQAIKLNKGDVEVLRGYIRKINLVVSMFEMDQLARTTRRKNAALEAEAEAKAKKKAERDDDEEPLDNNDGQPMNGQTATMGRSAFSTMMLDGMDLQQGVRANESSAPAPMAMNGSVTNGELSDDDDGKLEKVVDTTLGAAGTGGMSNDALDNTRVDDATANRQGGETTDDVDSDQES